MLDPKLLRTHLDEVVVLLKKKGVDFDVAHYQSLEERRKSLQIETEALQNKRKDGSKTIGLLMKEGRQDEAEQLKQEISQIGDALDALASEFDQVSLALDQLMMELPNLPDPSVPEGASETDNVEVAIQGTAPEFNFTPRDHIELGELFSGLDFDAAANLSGSRFVTMHGVFARLHGH